MTGVLKRQGNPMSDDNDSGGIFGAIISAFILVAIWPYLLALLGIYIAYMVALAILAWIAENWILMGLYVSGALGIYAIFRYRLIPKAWKRMLAHFRLKPVPVELLGIGEEVILSDSQNFAERKFIPSTNLYCYWCTKKLGFKAWERNGMYYCDECNQKASLYGC